MSDNKDIDINHLYSNMREGISTVVTVSNDLLSLNKDNTIDDAINLISEKLKALDYFYSFAVYKIKDLDDGKHYLVMLAITNLINLFELHINDLIVMKDNFTLLSTRKPVAIH